MSTKAKSALSAAITAVAGVFVLHYVAPEDQPTVAAAVGMIVGWLGLRQPGQ
jgi:hypothetical protein